MFNKKGFTLIELLGVLIILVIIFAITAPLVMNIIDDSRVSANVTSTRNLIDAASLFHKNKIAESASNSTMFNGQTNFFDQLDYNGDDPDSGYVYIDKNGNISLGVVFDGVCYRNDVNNDIVYFDYTEGVECGSGFIVEASGPELLSGMIAVTLEGDTPSNAVAKIADLDSWYDYDNKQWANTVIVSNPSTYTNAAAGTVINKADIISYYVWIPRYEYVVGTELNTQIAFANKEDDKKTSTTTGEWNTPSAFTNGSKELSGVWVGKYDISTTSENQIFNETEYYKNTFTSMRVTDDNSYYIDYRSIDELQLAVENFTTTGNEFGLSNATASVMTDVDVVKYFTYSQYGINQVLPKSDDYVTRNNFTTTGNITGVYDINLTNLTYDTNTYTGYDISFKNNSSTAYSNVNENVNLLSSKSNSISAKNLNNILEGDNSINTPPIVLQIMYTADDFFVKEDGEYDLATSSYPRIVGAVLATDPDGQAITYTHDGGTPRYGTFSLDYYNGEFEYRFTNESILAFALSEENYKETMTIRILDSAGGITVTTLAFEFFKEPIHTLRPMLQSN